MNPIYPTSLSKYYGNVHFHKTQKKFKATLLNICSKSFNDKIDAENYVKQMNIEKKLAIKNVIFDCETHYEIELTRGQKTKINKDDLDKVENCNWHAKYNQATKSFYVYNSKGDFLHNVIMNHKPCEITVDHINRDSLDNRKTNLRLATKSEQCLNRKELVIVKINQANKLQLKNIHETIHHDKSLIVCEFTKNNVKMRKQFSISKYTKEGAIKLAEQWRDSLL